MSMSAARGISLSGDARMLLSLSEKFLLLEEVQLLTPLPPRVRAALAHRARVRCFQEGELIVCAGEPSDRFFVLVSGRAVVLERGREVNRIDRWDSFGEAALLSQRPHDKSVLARTEVIVLTVSRTALMAALGRKRDGAARLSLAKAGESLSF